MPLGIDHVRLHGKLRGGLLMAVVSTWKIKSNGTLANPRLFHQENLCVLNQKKQCYDPKHLNIWGWFGIFFIRNYPKPASSACTMPTTWLLTKVRGLFTQKIQANQKQSRRHAICAKYGFFNFGAPCLILQPFWSCPKVSSSCLCCTHTISLRPPAGPSHCNSHSAFSKLCRRAMRCTGTATGALSAGRSGAASGASAMGAKVEGQGCIGQG